MEGFESALVARTAREVGCSAEVVQVIVSEWIERRPLRRLAALRYPLLEELFVALKRHGKIIGILSDYPARDKMEALGLVADHIVTAVDDDVNVLKPNPRD